MPQAEIAEKMPRRSPGRGLSFCLLAVLIVVQSGSFAFAVPAQEIGPCTEGDATRVVDQLGCFTLAQFQEILGFRNAEKDERRMRDALATAAGIVECMDGHQSFPDHPQQRKDFHCLQRILLDFYQRADSEQENAGDFHYQDLLSRASLKIHHCMIDEDLPITRCLSLMEEAFGDYQKVFDAARQVAGEAESPASTEIVQAMGINPEAPEPEFRILESFIDLCLENARRFPMLLGKPLGDALRPVLCDSYQLYSERRREVAQDYNLLVRFDGGNLAAASRLYRFMGALTAFLQPVRKAHSHLQLTPADWSNSPPPCGEDDWMFSFPEMSVRPGYHLPEIDSLSFSLNELEQLLAETARFGEQRIHLWKPFQSYGKLLYRLALSLKPAAARDPKVRDARHLLMEKARDALVLRAVDPAKYPLDVKVLRGPIREQIERYGTELLCDLQLGRLIEFNEGYFEANQSALDPAERTLLHRQLAIAYAVRNDETQSLDHLQQSDLKASDLEEIVSRFRELGVGHAPFE